MGWLAAPCQHSPARPAPTCLWPCSMNPSTGSRARWVVTRAGWAAALTGRARWSQEEGQGRHRVRHERQGPQGGPGGRQGRVQRVQVRADPASQVVHSQFGELKGLLLLGRAPLARCSPLKKERLHLHPTPAEGGSELRKGGR
jgi:hypothetical protein